jgi:hypothetical protein
MKHPRQAAETTKAVNSLALTCAKEAGKKYLRRYISTLIYNDMENIEMATIQQRRETDRARQKRWRERKLAEGQKPMLIMLTPEAQKVLKCVKEHSGETYVQIINRSIIEIGKTLPGTSEEIEVWHPG